MIFIRISIKRPCEGRNVGQGLFLCLFIKFVCLAGGDTHGIMVVECSFCRERMEKMKSKKSLTAAVLLGLGVLLTGAQAPQVEAAAVQLPVVEVVYENMDESTINEVKYLLPELKNVQFQLAIYGYNFLIKVV